MAVLVAGLTFRTTTVFDPGAKANLSGFEFDALFLACLICASGTSVRGLFDLVRWLFVVIKVGHGLVWRR
jgi:hypothetical protein